MIGTGVEVQCVGDLRYGWVWYVIVTVAMTRLAPGQFGRIGRHDGGSIFHFCGHRRNSFASCLHADPVRKPLGATFLLTLHRDGAAGAAVRTDTASSGEKRFYVQTVPIWATESDTHLLTALRL